MVTMFAATLRIRFVVDYSVGSLCDAEAYPTMGNVLGVGMMANVEHGLEQDPWGLGSVGSAEACCH